MSDQIQAELSEIAAQAGGVLYPKAVVEFAQDEGTALHAEFEWDDTTAADAFRIQQARQIIRLQVTFEPKSDSETRLYVSLASDRTATGGYRSIHDVMRDPVAMGQLQAQVRQEMQRMHSKYHHVENLAQIAMETFGGEGEAG